MSKHLQRDLDNLQRDILTLATSVEETIYKAIHALQDRDVESVYLMASPEYSFLRSSGVKEIATFGGDISSLVPPRVALRLQEELTRQRTTR